MLAPGKVVYEVENTEHLFGIRSNGEKSCSTTCVSCHTRDPKQTQQGQKKRSEDRSEAITTQETRRSKHRSNPHKTHGNEARSGGRLPWSAACLGGLRGERLV